jgi:large subunit ribosomal protein L3
MKYLIGTKLQMTQHFDEKGIVTPVTAISVAPNVVTAIKTLEKDGYTAVQVGYGTQKESRVNQAQLKANDGKAYQGFQEFRTDGAPEVAIGDQVALDAFSAGESVVVTGTSKSKGFQGVVKRHGFHGGPRSHGQKHSEREAGSIGGGPGRAGGRVVKGMRMAGRTGGDTVTVKGLKVVAVDTDTSTIFISGAVPGRRGTLVRIVSMS